MDFGEAIRSMREGVRVRRTGWNGKGMWLMLVPAEKWSAWAPHPHHRLPWIAMKTADDGLVPWFASQTDMLADDWERVDELGAAPEEDPFAPLPLEQALKAFDETTVYPRTWRELLGMEACFMGVLGVLGFNGQCITFVPNDRVEMAKAVREDFDRDPLSRGYALPSVFLEGQRGYPTYEVRSDTIHERVAGIVQLRPHDRVPRGSWGRGLFPLTRFRNR